MSESTKKIRRRDCVRLSNKIIERCKLPIPRVTSIDGIRSNLFTSLLQVLYHRLPEGVIEDPASTEDEIANVQSIVNHLALDLIHIDLSHISGADVIAGEPRAIYNLLEIFCGLHKYLSATSIGQWNLEETLTETNSELSSRPSSEESAASGGQLQGAEDEEIPAPPEPSPPLSRPPSGVARAASAGSVGAVRSSTAAGVGPSASGASRVSSGASAARAVSGGSLGAGGRSGSVVRVPSGESAGRVPSGGSVGRVPSIGSAGRLPSNASAGRVPSGGSAAGRVPSSTSAGRVPSGESAGRVLSSGSAGRVPSSASAGRVPSSGSAARVPSSASAGKVASRVSSVPTSKPPSGGASRVPSLPAARRSSSGVLPASSSSRGGEGESSLLPSSGSGPGLRRSVSSGGGSGGAGAAGSSGAGAEVGEAQGGGKEVEQVEQTESDTSAGGGFPLRAPSSGPGGEFAGLGRPSATRPSPGGLPESGSGAAVQLSGSIEHHHYHHYEEESAEGSQLTGETADSGEEYGSSAPEDRQEEDSALTEEPTADYSPEEEDTRPDSEPDCEPRWELTEDSPEEVLPRGEDTRPDSEPGSEPHWELTEDSPEDVLPRGEDTRDAGESSPEEEGGQEDISRRLSEELRLMREQSSAEPAPEPRSSDTEPKRSTSAFRREPSYSRVTETEAAMQRSGGGWGGQRSAPVSRRPSRRRSSDFSSASEPGIGGRAARPPVRNVETIAEIRETGGERAVTETTRQQAGDRLEKETIRREVRRKISSAPPTRQVSYRKQATRRSVCSDGVTDWLESQADDTCLRVDPGEADVFEYLRREFPYVHVSAETKRRLLSQYRQQMKYVMSLVEPVESRKIKIRRQDVLKRQALLTDIMHQQKAHDDRFKQIADAKRREARVRNLPRDSKISCLRAQRYVNSFQQQFQSRSALNKSREELLLRAVFEEMLEIQRSRLRAVRRLEKQAIADFYDADGYTSDLNRVHQYYEANFRELAELLSKERSDLVMAQQQQSKLADRIRREFREYMEADVRSLNDKIVNSWQPQFRELDADRVRSDLYEANWKFCVQ